MMRSTKTVQGMLLDIEDQEPLAEASVTITLIQGHTPHDLPKYEVELVVSGYRPELDRGSYYLKLGDNLVGEVFISITGIPSRAHTRFKVFLQDDVWNNVDWFHSLQP